MNRRTPRWPLLVLMLFVVGCEEPADSPLGPADPNLAVHVSSRQQLMDALVGGHGWIILDETIYFNSASETINLSDSVPPGVTQLRIEGAGGFESDAGGNLVRNFNGGNFSYLITAEHDRDWEFRLEGLRVDGNGYTGSGIRLNYIQLSVIEDVRFDDVDGYPFYIGDGGSTLATEFRDVQFHGNRLPAYIVNASDIRWQGGANFTNWGNYWDSGLRIFAGVHDPANNKVGGPVLIEDFYMHGGDLFGYNIHELTFRGGTCLGCNIRFYSTVGHDVSCNGFFDNAWLWVNGAQICYNDP